MNGVLIDADIKYTMPFYMNEADINAVIADPIISSLIDSEPELRQLIEAFIDRLPGMIRELEALLVSDDVKSLEGKLHDLQGVGGGYGFADISLLADEMMLALGDKQLVQMSLLLKKFWDIQSRIILDNKVK